MSSGKQIKQRIGAATSAETGGVRKAAPARTNRARNLRRGKWDSILQFLSERADEEGKPNLE